MTRTLSVRQPARLAGVVVIAALTCANLVQRAGTQEKPGPVAARPFDERTAAAWKKAGAALGWIAVNQYGIQEFRPQADGLAGAVPACRIAKWQENLFAKLPDPALPFGLTLTGADVTDAGLKGLASLKTLQLLYLGQTLVTDAGLKELASLKSLQTLDLGGTRVTDVGVASLRKALPGCKIIR